MGGRRPGARTTYVAADAQRAVRHSITRVRYPGVVSTPPLPLATSSIVAIRVSGNVHPNTAPTVELLDLARAYFRLLVKDAQVSFDGELDLVGLTVEDKCASVEAVTRSPDLARRVIANAAAYSHGERLPPHGATGYVAELRTALAEITSRGYSVRMMVGEDFAVPLVPQYIPPPRATSETGTWRAYIQKLGGAEPRVKVEVRGLGSFSLSAKRELVSSMHAYTSAEITARLDRDADGCVRGGELYSVEPVESADPAAIYERVRAWFTENATSDADFDTVEAALGREAPNDG